MKEKFTVIALVFSFVLLFSVPFIAGASELRVSQLGDQWLVPDDYVDVLINPARINFINNNIFTARDDDYITTDWNVSYNNIQWTTIPRMAFLGRFGMFNAGLIYSLNNYAQTDYGRITGRTMRNDITAVVGMKLGDNISIGLTPRAGFLSEPYMQSSVAYDGSLGLGFNFGTDNLDLGLSIDGTNKFTGLNNYNFDVNIPGGMRLDGGAQIRFFNKFSDNYDVNNQPIPFNPYGDGVFFGDKSVNNLTGVSYINDFNGINYFVEIINNWNIYSYYNHSLSVVPFTSSDEVTDRGDEVDLHLGFEAKLFTDWLSIRIGFTPARYYHTDYSDHNKTGANDDYSREVTNDLVLLNMSGASIGFGINLGNDMKLDAGFNVNGLYNSGNTDYTYSYTVPPEQKDAQDYSYFSAEFTLKW